LNWTSSAALEELQGTTTQKFINRLERTEQLLDKKCKRSNKLTHPRPTVTMNITEEEMEILARISSDQNQWMKTTKK
jgi:hypothetical protein